MTHHLSQHVKFLRRFFHTIDLRAHSLDSFLSLAHASLIITDDDASNSVEFILICIIHVIFVQCEALSTSDLRKYLFCQTREITGIFYDIEIRHLSVKKNKKTSQEGFAAVHNNLITNCQSLNHEMA